MSISRVLEFDNNKIVSDDSNKSNKKFFKFKKYLVLKHIFIFSKLAFIDIQIETKIAYF